jgi:hypothetical protein
MLQWTFPTFAESFSTISLSCLILVGYQLGGNSVINNSLFFTGRGLGKAWLYLSEYISSQNSTTGSADNSLALHENPLHSSNRFVVYRLLKTNCGTIVLRRDWEMGNFCSICCSYMFFVTFFVHLIKQNLSKWFTVSVCVFYGTPYRMMLWQGEPAWTLSSGLWHRVAWQKFTKIFGGKYSYTLEMETKLSSEKMINFWHYTRLLMLECSILIYGNWLSDRPLTRIHSIHFINYQRFRISCRKDEFCR